jgi:pseudouridine synthase, RluA family
MLEYTIIATEEHENIRLDILLSTFVPELTRNSAQKLLLENAALVNGKSRDKNYRVKIADVIIITIPNAVPLDVLPEDIPLDIFYEDDELLIVNKHKGMVVHPGAGNSNGTLVNALLYHCRDNLSGINGILRPGIVHRIDKDTSGLLLVAKTNETHLSLAKQLEEHTINRTYHAVSHGEIKEQAVTISAPIGRSKTNRLKMAIDEKNGKQAVTHVEVLENLPNFSYIQCKLETGRTHQIRVHMASINHPLAGDTVYGPKKAIQELHGQCLHAKTIGFIHPATNNYMEFNSDLPNYFETFLQKHRKALIHE